MTVLNDNTPASELTPKHKDDRSATERLRSSSGFLIEEANTPAGASRAGANKEEARMFGTPAQQQSDPSKTLESRERFEKPGAAGPTDAQQQAKDSAENLASLGPVRAAVTARIQEELNTQQDLSEEVNVDYLTQVAQDHQWSAENKQDVQYALEQYQASKTDTAYEMLQEAIAVANGELGSFTVGRENIGSLYNVDYGVDLSGQNKMELLVSADEATQLNNTPGLEGWQGMTLSQFEAALDQLEAQQFQTAESLRAQLADPSLPPQLRQQLLAEYAQLSSAGITGAEEAIDRLDEQLQMDAQLEIGGVAMSLEEILNDESLSQLIANAVTDLKYLETLEEDLNYAGLGKWIRDNAEDLSELVGELETQIVSYDKVQNDLKKEFAKFSEEDIPAVLEFLGLDAIPDSMTGTEWNNLLTTIEGSTGYQYLRDNYDEINLLEGGLDSLVKMEENGYSESEMDQAFEYANSLQHDDNLKTLTASLDMYSSKEDLATVGRISTMLDTLNDDDGDSALTALLSTGVELDEEDLEYLTSHANPSQFIKEWQETESAKKSFRDSIEYYISESASLNPNDMVELRKIIGVGEDYGSFMNSWKYSDDETKQELLSIFDTSGDNQISEEEFSIIDPNRIASAIDFDPATDFSSRPDMNLTYQDELLSGAKGYDSWLNASGFDKISAMIDVPQEILTALEAGSSIESAVWHHGKRLSSLQYAELAAIADDRGWNKSLLQQYASHQGRSEFFGDFGKDNWSLVTQSWQDPSSIPDVATRNLLAQLADKAKAVIDDPEKSADRRAWASHAYHRALQAINKYDATARDTAAAEAAAAEATAAEERGLVTEPTTQVAAPMHERDKPPADHQPVRKRRFKGWAKKKFGSESAFYDKFRLKENRLWIGGQWAYYPDSEEAARTRELMKSGDLTESDALRRGHPSNKW